MPRLNHEGRLLARGIRVLSLTIVLVRVRAQAGKAIAGHVIFGSGRPSILGLS